MGNNESNTKNNSTSNTKKVDKVKIVAKRYEFGGKIGCGASCIVVEGFDVNNKNSKFAIKILEKSRKTSKLFYDREVGVLSRLNHKNIVKFIEGYEDDSNYYVVTRLYGGGDLFDRMMNIKYKITENIAISLISNMLSAIKYLHENNVVHRDLKPENYLFSDIHNDTDLTLCDFGSAKIVNDDQEYDEVNKTLIGSIYYIAPELVREDIKIRKTGKLLKCSDIWSVGIAAYIMLTGIIPFRGKTNKIYFKHVINDQVIFPSNCRLSNGVKDFILKILVKDPYKRISIDAALRHPWIQGVDDGEIMLNNEIITYLQQYSYQNKLKRNVTKALAKNMRNDDKPKKHFNRLDIENKGYLNVEDLKQLLLNMGDPRSKANIKSKLMLKAADHNKDGKIDYNEFKQLWQRRMLCQDMKYIKSVFNVFDKNGDGYIDATELERILTVYSGYIKEMIQEVDEDNDGKLSFVEFKKAMLEQLCVEEMIYGHPKSDHLKFAA